MPPDILSLLQSCAKAYRQGREAEAAVVMQRLIALLSESIDAKPALLTQNLEHSITAALHHQQTQDWIGLADELQYVLAPSIEESQQATN